MSENRIPQTPWILDEDGFIYSNGKSIADFYINDDDIDDREQRKQMAISAVNGTYGKGIHPDAVEDLLDVVKKFLEVTNDRWRPLPATSYEKAIMSSARAAIAKSIIK